MPLKVMHFLFKVGTFSEVLVNCSLGAVSDITSRSQIA